MIDFVHKRPAIIYNLHYCLFSFLGEKRAFRVDSFSPILKPLDAIIILVSQPSITMRCISSHFHGVE